MATWSTKKAFGASIQRMGSICTNGTVVWFIAHSGSFSDIVYEYDPATNTETQILDGSVDITNYESLRKIIAFGGNLYAVFYIYDGVSALTTAEFQLFKYTNTPNSWTQVDAITIADGRGEASERLFSPFGLFASASTLVYSSSMIYGPGATQYYSVTRYSTDGSTFNTAGSDPYDARISGNGYSGSPTKYPFGIYEYAIKDSDGSDSIWKFNESSNAWEEVINGGDASYGYWFTSPDAAIHFVDFNSSCRYTNDGWSSTAVCTGSGDIPVFSYNTASQFAFNSSTSDLYTFSGGATSLLDTLSLYVASYENIAIIRLSDGTSLIFGRNFSSSNNGIILERSASLPAPPTPSLTHSAAGLPGAILI